MLRRSSDVCLDELSRLLAEYRAAEKDHADYVRGLPWWKTISNTEMNKKYFHLCDCRKAWEEAILEVGPGIVDALKAYRDAK